MKSLAAASDKPIIPWTGAIPAFGQCAGVRADGTIHSLPLITTHSNRQQLLDYFENTWALTEVLFSGLASLEAFYKRPYHQLRHPLIFYYGHPAVLYVNKLRVAGLLDAPVNAEFERLFETGVDEMRWDDLHEGNSDIWPALEKVTLYRQRVYSLIRNLIKTHPQLNPENLPITQGSPMWALIMSFEHERIHLETSSVLMRELPLDCLRKPWQWPALPNEQSSTKHPSNAMRSMDRGTVNIGKPSQWPSFGWDNEYGKEVREHSSFKVSEFLISNGQFKEFVEAGGYGNEKFWSKDGWEWRKFRNTKWPTFWVPSGPAGLHEYKLRTIFEVIEMPWNWPVCVNYHEAKAYCAWKTMQDGATEPYRLLTEAEHHALRDSKLTNLAKESAADPVMTGKWTDSGLNLNLSSGSERPVNAGSPNDKGIYDSFGNVWQWSEDTFHPLPGSRPHPFYEDFSAPCYDGQHQMIFGGSFISTGDEASIWARFHFRPHFFQHAGFRIVQSEKPIQAISPVKTGNQIYETQSMIDKYLLMHWGTESEIWGQSPQVSRPPVVHLPVKCAELVARFSQGSQKALDLGCAVGRSSFELARQFRQVLGIDYSQEFIACANELKKEMRISYDRKDSGDKWTTLKAVVDPEIDVRRIEFKKGDACHLPPDLEQFDAVLLANVLCRLQDPKKCLLRMQGPHALVKPGGTLVMTTPFSWLEDYTPKENWIDGIAGVQKVLTEFECIHQEELPFLIREHSRKFEYIITLASVWRRKTST